MAAAVLILRSLPGHQPELLSALVGSILTVSRESLAVIATIALAVTATVLRLRRSLPFMTYDVEGGSTSGCRSRSTISRRRWS